MADKGNMWRVRMALTMLAASAAALAQTGCSDGSFNPYLDGNAHRNLGQTVEAIAGLPGDAANYIDFRVEKILY
jgi:hypothetical protein